MKKTIVGLLIFLLLSGCVSSEKLNSKEPMDEVLPTLAYYTIGWEDKDLGLVNKEMNRLLEEKIGIHMEYYRIGWSEYDQKLKTILSSGVPVDVAFVYYNYPKQAKEGVWLALDDYLEGDYQVLYETVNPLLWEAVKISDGHIYGVPTNKEVAVQEHWIYPQELVDKYNIDITQYRTLASLEPLLRLISEEEPDYLPMELDKMSHDFFVMYGYENLAPYYSCLAVNINHQPLTVVNLYGTPEAEEIFRSLRQYYQAGYINSDAALRQTQELEKGQKTFWKEASGGVYSAAMWSRDRGYPLVSFEVSPMVVTSKSATDAVMAVSATTRYPKESLDFLTLLNTDPALRNLLNFGIQGTHYILDENEQVNFIDDGYRGVQYTQGNWFILHTTQGEPLDKWEMFQQKNKEAVRSPLLGFTPDTSGFAVEMQQIQGIWEKYYPCLMTGSVDLQIEWPKFLLELEQAGINDVKQALQQQLDDWVKTQR